MKTLFTRVAVLFCFLFGTTAAFAQLSGSYTIDPSGSGSTNYTSVSAAANALMSVGVSGPVTFTIASGTYTGQVSLSKALTGVSATNTVTFRGKTGNRKDVILSNTGTYVLYMPAVDYITFKNVSIVHGGTYGIYMNSNADHNTFDNVRITFTGSGTGYNIYNYQAEFNTFNECLVENGYMGIYNYGWNTSDLQEGTTITNCQFYKHTTYGIYSYYGADLIMDKIDLDSFSGNYPMYIMYNNRTTLANSRINAPTITTYLYWYYNNYNGTTKDTSHVYNNILNIGSSSSYAFYGYYMTRNKWYNNSISFKASSYGAYFYYIDGCEFYNNNWNAEGGTYGMYMYYPTSGYTNMMDYNNLDWNGGSSWGVISQYGFSSLAQQRTTLSALNANSMDVDPAFESQKDGDLRSYSPNLNNSGTKANWITGGVDIDKNDRPATGDTKFDIGCNEFFLSPNDLDIKGLISPLSVNPTGNNTITANFKNTGSATLSSQSVEYQYSVDSGKTWSKGISGTISSLSPGQSYNVDLTKTWNPGRKGDFRIGVRMSKQVSNDPDAKDEIFVDVCSGLSGTYTVGRSSSDFPTLAEAMKKLNCGLAGHVTLVLAGGTRTAPQATYSQLKFNNLHGSANATLTIDGQHSDSVKISRTSTSFEGNIEINNCSYINFKNMTLDVPTGTGCGVHIVNNAHHNSVSNCVINGNNSTTNSGVSLSGGGPTTATVVNDNLIENNLIKGTYYGMTQYSSGGTPSASNSNVFKNNTITDYYYYGIMCYYSYNTTVDGNKFINPRYTSNYPFYWYYNSKSTVSNNLIGDYYAYSFYFMYENQYSTKDESIVVNNMVNGVSSYPSATNGYGTYFYNPYNLKIWHNTFTYDQTTQPTSATTSSVGAAFKAYYGYNWDIQNNIFYTPMAISGAAPLFFYNPYSIVKMEGNNYSHPNGIVANIAYANLSSIAALQSALSGTNVKAYATSIQFAGGTDYHLSTTKPNLRGADIGLSTDIDGDSRCLFAPSIGADESGYPIAKTRAFFAVADTTFIYAATQFSNQAKAIDPLLHSWFVDGKYAGNPVDLEYRFKATGSYRVKLISEGCGGIDTFEKTVYVKIPNSAPKVDFLASKTVVDVFESVNFKNITTNGPESFYWRIDSYFVHGQYGLPEVSHNFVNGTDSTSTDPSIEFTNPGIYSVSLYATNLRGSDSAIKTNLITVRQTADMCGFNNSATKNQGKLFDEGGPTGAYVANRKLCDFLVDPCTDEIRLTINSFNLAAGSYLRIYDGIDNTGKPLHAYDPAFSQGLTGDMTQLSNFKTTFTATSGEVYFEFTSAAATASGFEILWDANVINPTAPSLSLTAIDTVCVETPFVITNGTIGQDVSYEWFMDTTTINFFNGADYVTEDVTHQYDFAGTYYIKMIASNCGGADSSIFPIVVVAPKSAPKPAFTVSNKRPAIGDEVTLTDASTSGAHPCISEWEWKISPSTYSFVSGYDMHSQNPKVLFSDTGCYDISLTVSNSFGSSTYQMTCGVFSISTCIPSVKITGTDVGISRVVIGSIDNRSTIHEDGYENFVNSASTNLEIGATYNITIERPTTGSTSMNRAVWVDYNQDGAFDNSELVTSSKADNNLSWTGSFTIPSSATKGSARLRVGTNLGTFKQYGCGPNQFGEFEDYRVFITEDRQAPVIVFVGAKDTSVEQCGTWTDPGASGLDNVDGVVSLTSTLSGVDMTTAGIYTVVYKAEDKSGNIGSGTRIVRVTADATAPVIMLNGNATMAIEVKGIYADPGFTASDNCGKVDAADVVVTGKVDETTLGTYTITYTLQDDDNNSVKVTRTVNVVDTEAPTATLLGNANDTVEVFGTYTEMGIDPVDNYYTNLTYKVTGTVNVNVLGKYELKYTSTDGSGNTSTELTRTVYVVDREAPQVRLALGADTTLTIDVWSKYAPEYIDIDDNYYSESSIRPTLVKSGTYVTTFGGGAASELGNYTYTYTVNDGSNNFTTATRNIIVADREAPKMSFTNGPTMLIKRWTVLDPLKDVDFTTSDNFAAEKDLKVSVKSNNIDKNSTGIYHVEYNVEDPSGNVGTYTLTIAVTDVTTDISTTEIHADIYPNPTNGVLNINVDLAGAGRTRVSIINSLGQEVMVIAEQATSNINTTVDLSNLSAGVYNVQIVSNNQRMVKKVTVTE